jgi:3-deoxy-manno-octulosonate cytidylyltransferase (CMP-KDO synthetase)
MTIHDYKVLAIIPARFASTRFPGKPLVDLGGKPMIQRTFERVMSVDGWHRVVIATDDLQIKSAAESFGAEVIMTRADHISGTDRCAEVLDILGNDFDYVVNVQGDEPFIEPGQLLELATGFESQAPILTLIKRIYDEETLFSANSPKVVVNARGEALYFSRQTIPYLRGIDPSDWLASQNYFKHIGLYAYRSDVLKEISQLKPSPLELAESLEQLRWLEHGYLIQTIETQFETVGIDTPADLEKIKKMGLV